MKTSTDITTPIGFYETFFSLLPFYRSKEDAFNYLNNEVGNIIGVKPYKTFKKWSKSKFK